MYSKQRTKPTDNENLKKEIKGMSSRKDETFVKSESKVDDGIRLNNANILQPSGLDERVELTDDMARNLKKREQELHEMEIRKIAESIGLAVPTADMEVKLYLRQFGHPICLFGEGQYERRERLRLLVARVCAGGDASEKGDQTKTNKVEENTLFYVKGNQEIIQIRKFITTFSMNRVFQRMKKKRMLMDSISRVEYEEDKSLYIKHLKDNFTHVLSQVGDERPLTCGRFSYDGGLFATTSWTGLIKLWNLSDFNVYSTLKGHTDRVHNLCWRPGVEISFPPDFINLKEERQEHEKINESNLVVKNFVEGKNEDEGDCNVVQLASAGADGTILLWNVQKKNSVGVLQGHEERINRVEFHPSGFFIASTSHDETWRFWDVGQQKEVFFQEGHAYPIYALKFNTEGSLVFTGDLGGIVRATDLRIGRTVGAVVAHVKQVMCVDVNPQISHHLSTCSDDHTLKIWDLRKLSNSKVSSNPAIASKYSKSACLHLILAHNKLISECRYEPMRGRYLLSSSYDSTLKMWSAEDYEFSCLFQVYDSQISCIDVSRCGDMIASLSHDRTWSLWKNQSKFESLVQDSLFTSDDLGVDGNIMN